MICNPEPETHPSGLQARAACAASSIGDAYSWGLQRASTPAAWGDLCLLSGKLPGLLPGPPSAPPLCPHWLLLASWTPWPSIRLGSLKAGGTRSQPCQLEIKDLLHRAGSSPETPNFDYPLGRRREADLVSGFLHCAPGLEVERRDQGEKRKRQRGWGSTGPSGTECLQSRGGSEWHCQEHPDLLSGRYACLEQMLLEDPPRMSWHEDSEE